MSLQESLNGMAFSPPPTLLSFSEMGFGLLWIGLKLPSQLKRSLDWWCSCKTLSPPPSITWVLGLRVCTTTLGKGVLGVKRRALCLPGEHPADWAASLALHYSLWRLRSFVFIHVCVCDVCMCSKWAQVEASNVCRDIFFSHCSPLVFETWPFTQLGGCMIQLDWPASETLGPAPVPVQPYPFLRWVLGIWTQVLMST